MSPSEFNCPTRGLGERGANLCSPRYLQAASRALRNKQVHGIHLRQRMGPGDSGDVRVGMLQRLPR